MFNPIFKENVQKQKVGARKADSRLAPSQWETSLQSNAISHWLGTNLESTLCMEPVQPSNRKPKCEFQNE